MIIWKKNNIIFISHNDYKEIWVKENKDICNSLDDNLYSHLGCILIDILIHVNMIKK